MMSSGGERVEEEKVIRKKLSLAVKSIQWSYSIFWSLSSTQSGVLEWGEGYYNGDIKTRKTVVQCAEKSREEEDDDEFGIDRTEQLRKLYDQLLLSSSSSSSSTSENNNNSSSQTKRPSSASLSPDDLTDSEWYFLVCMSFSFPVGNGLPGRTFSNNQTIWLCNAHCADSKVFSRSLLAKSASIQTVVCFPYLGGVVEFGVTELVYEDPNIIEQIKASLLEIPQPNIASKISINEREHANKLDQDIDICEEANEIRSPDKISSKFELVDQVQSWQDDEISNRVQLSTSSSDCVSQNLTTSKKVNDDFVKDDGHYQRVLSTLLKTSDCLILGPSCRNGKRGSSFVSWKKGELSGSESYRSGSSQRLLKKVVFEVGLMHGGCLLQSQEENGMRDKLWRPEVDEIDMNHVLLDRRRRDTINERFSILGELVPSTSKVDKLSMLDKTIEYLKELERKVEELESCKGAPKVEETRTKNKPNDVVERTSDNYGDKRLLINKRNKLVTNKRKACDTEEIGIENNRFLTRDGLANDITVSKIDKNVLIEIKCHWKENLLLEIVDEMSNLHLDTHSVQSSKVDEILSVIIKAQLKRSTKISVGTIRQALQRVIQKR